ncbi:ATP-dependent nuclease [Vibrio jasicida]|uniref:ATP-dependent nuclease n=1 Tax=Vibrio jasicida TaxID=766224 RepID=UPI0003A1C8EB|nr:AAA family ATPase [Vibrio jasicida]
MYLHTLSIKGYKRLVDVKVDFNEATFLIGQNNSGKSSLLKAIEYLLSGKQMPVEDFHSVRNEEGECERAVEEVEMIAEFRDVSQDSRTWRGFAGRTFSYDVEDGSEETGISIIYRKIWTPGKAPVQYLKAFARELKEEYRGLKTIESFIEAGISEELLIEAFDKAEGNITAKNKERLDYIDELWNITEREEFFKNPGGIPGNVLSRLPRYLPIPAESGEGELSKASGTLQKTLKELFKDVRDNSVHYAHAQNYLNSLAAELDPTDENSDFGQLLTQLNTVMSSLFPESSVHVSADLSNPDDVLVPQFDIELESNVRTPISHQGTGVIRSAVFSLLRFRKMWEEQRDNNNGRGLIIGFEEPEIFLHPSAANQMRATIYDLVGRHSQILASTHSPYMIDLSRKPKQNLIRFTKTPSGSEIINFSVSRAFQELQGNDQTYLKMLLKLDDYVSRAFFSERTILVEGDTEDIVIRETTARLSAEQRDYVRSSCEVIKGRGKPVLISLIKYLKAVGITPVVMHDSDEGTAGAELHNEHIRAALDCDENLFVLSNCMEDVLNYDAPSREKPYRAFRETMTWGNDFDDVPADWRSIYTQLMGL